MENCNCINIKKFEDFQIVSETCGCDKGKLKTDAKKCDCDTKKTDDVTVEECPTCKKSKCGCSDTKTKSFEHFFTKPKNATKNFTEFFEDCGECDKCDVCKKSLKECTCEKDKIKTFADFVK